MYLLEKCMQNQKNFLNLNIRLIKLLKLDRFFIWNNKTYKYVYFNYLLFVKPFSTFWIYKWIFDRLEMFVKSEMEKIYYYDMIRPILYLFLPDDVSIKDRQLFYIYIKFGINSYQGYRHFFNLPVRGNRTWSNHKSQKKSSFFFEFYRQYYFSMKWKNCQKSRQKALLYAYVMNKLWYFQFRKEWDYAKSRREEYEATNKYVFWKFDLRSLLANRVIVFTEKPEKILKKNKKRKNKKKIKIRKNLFNIGFSFNFIRSLQKIIFRHFFVIKRFI